MEYLFIPGIKKIFCEHQLEAWNYCLSEKVDTMDSQRELIVTRNW